MKVVFATVLASYLISFNAFACEDTPASTDPVSVSFEDFKKDIHERIGAELTGDACTVTTKEVRNTIEITIRKGGRLKTLTYNDRDQIKATTTGEAPINYVLTYNTGERNNLIFTHMDDAYDHVTIDLGGRKTTCEINY
jgi:hypothetical protein